jgi:hypothetical protein
MAVVLAVIQERLFFLLKSGQYELYTKSRDEGYEGCVKRHRQPSSNLLEGGL